MLRGNQWIQRIAGVADDHAGICQVATDTEVAYEIVEVIRPVSGMAPDTSAFEFIAVRQEQRYRIHRCFAGSVFIDPIS